LGDCRQLANLKGNGRNRPLPAADVSGIKVRTRADGRHSPRPRVPDTVPGIAGAQGCPRERFARCGISLKSDRRALDARSASVSAPLPASQVTPPFPRQRQRTACLAGYERWNGSLQFGLRSGGDVTSTRRLAGNGCCRVLCSLEPRRLTECVKTSVDAQKTGFSVANPSALHFAKADLRCRGKPERNRRSLSRSVGVSPRAAYPEPTVVAGARYSFALALLSEITPWPP